METKLKTKLNNKWLVALGLAGLVAASSAQATITLTFDENGNTSASSGTDPYSNLGVVTDDKPQGIIGGAQLPGVNGVGGTTLDYGAQLGGVFGNVSGAYPQLGWIAIYAYGTPSSAYGTTTGLLDLIHWDNSITVPPVSGTLYQSMYWYSQEGSGNLADHFGTLSSTIVSQVLAYTYTTDITEGGNGLAVYTPAGSNNGGYSTSGSSPTQYTYDFQSSIVPVPEPTTVIAGILLLLPFGASTLRILSRNRTA
jgi:hypothetical protein